jgi:hypothetical protein
MERPMPGNLAKLAGDASLGFILYSNLIVRADVAPEMPDNSKHIQKITARPTATKKPFD